MVKTDLLKYLSGEEIVDEEDLEDEESHCTFLPSLRMIWIGKDAYLIIKYATVSAESFCMAWICFNVVASWTNPCVPNPSFRRLFCGFDRV